MTLRPLVSCLIFVMASPAWAAKPKVQPSKPPKAESKSTDKLLWDYWYTVTLENRIRYGYYNDRVEIKSGKIKLQHHFWKKEGSQLVREDLGGTSEDNDDVTPVFYNFHSSVGSDELNIDTTVSTEGGASMLTAKVRKGVQDLAPVRRPVRNKFIFSEFFSVWLGRRLSKLKPGSPNAFISVLEDNLQLKFADVSGSVKLEPNDEFALRSKTKRVLVDQGGRMSIWYVEPDGTAVRILMPSDQILVERATAEDAKKFLGP
jgi:hypothetical protein